MRGGRCLSSKYSTVSCNTFRPSGGFCWSGAGCRLRPNGLLASDVARLALSAANVSCRVDGCAGLSRLPTHGGRGTGRADGVVLDGFRHQRSTDRCARGRVRRHRRRTFGAGATAATAARCQCRTKDRSLRVRRGPFPSARRAYGRHDRRVRPPNGGSIRFAEQSVPAGLHA